jgi:hypothetical protein
MDVGSGSHIRHPSVQDTADDRNIVELIMARLMRIDPWLKPSWEV